MIFVYIIVGIVVFLVFIQQMMIQRMKKMKGKNAPSLAGKAGQVIKEGKKSLFYFYSPTCGACRSMTPVIGEMAKKNSRVFKIDISQDMETARRFGVMATPTTIVVEKGIIQDLLIGPKPESYLRSMLK